MTHGWSQAPSASVAPRSFFTLFQATGFVGPLLILLGLAAAVIAVRRILELRFPALAPQDLQRTLERAVQSGQHDAAAAQALGNRSCLGQLVTAGLSLRASGLDEMLANVERTAARESMRLANRIANLARLGVVIIILGVFGTVSGLVSSAAVLEILKAPVPKDFVAAIGESLASTVFALGIALLCFVAYFWLDAKLVQRIVRVREIAEEMMHECAAKRA